MKTRSRRITSLLLAGSMLATGAAGIGMSSAMAHDNGGAQGAARQDARPGKAVRTAVEAAIAQAIGVTPDELKAARKAGTSPATLAQQKGVARDAVVTAAVAAMKANKPAGAPDRTDAQLTQKAERIVDNARPGHGPGGRGAHRR